MPGRLAAGKAAGEAAGEAAGGGDPGPCRAGLVRGAADPGAAAVLGLLPPAGGVAAGPACAAAAGGTGRAGKGPRAAGARGGNLAQGLAGARSRWWEGPAPDGTDVAGGAVLQWHAFCIPCAPAAVGCVAL